MFLPIVDGTTATAIERIETWKVLEGITQKIHTHTPYKRDGYYYLLIAEGGAGLE